MPTALIFPEVVHQEETIQEFATRLREERKEDIRSIWAALIVMVVFAGSVGLTFLDSRDADMRVRKVQQQRKVQVRRSRGGILWKEIQHYATIDD